MKGSRSVRLLVGRTLVLVGLPVLALGVAIATWVWGLRQDPFVNLPAFNPLWPEAAVVAVFSIPLLAGIVYLASCRDSRGLDRRLAGRDNGKNDAKPPASPNAVAAAAFSTGLAVYLFFGGLHGSRSLGEGLTLSCCFGAAGFIVQKARIWFRARRKARLPTGA